MEIKLDNDQLKTVVSEAILQSLDATKKDELIKSALAYLLTPQNTTTYGRKGESPIQCAFNNALEFLARDTAKEMLASDESIQTTIRGLISDAVKALGERNREDTVMKISNAIASGLSSSAY